MNTIRATRQMKTAGASLLIAVVSSCLVVAQEDAGKKAEKSVVATETRWPVDAPGWAPAQLPPGALDENAEAEKARASAIVVTVSQDPDGSCRVTFRVLNHREPSPSVALVGPNRLAKLLGEGLEVSLSLGETGRIIGVRFGVEAVPDRCCKQWQYYRFALTDIQNHAVSFSLVVQLSDPCFSKLVAGEGQISVDLSPAGPGFAFLLPPPPGVFFCTTSTVAPAVIWEVSQPMLEGFSRRRVPETWTSHAGETMLATFVRLDSARQLITFRLPDGRNIDVPTRNLAPSSRARAQLLSETYK